MTWEADNLESRGENVKHVRKTYNYAVFFNIKYIYECGSAYPLVYIPLSELFTPFSVNPPVLGTFGMAVVRSINNRGV